MHRLSFFTTLREACGFVWQERRDFLAFAYLPVIANALLDVAKYESLPQPLPQTVGEIVANLSAMAAFIWFASLVATVGFYVVFAVAWHRRTLLPGETSTVGEALRWRARHWRFFAATVLLALAGGFALQISGLVAGQLGGALLGQAGGIVSMLVLFVVMTVLVRFLPLFAAIAVDDRQMTPRTVWRLTRGNGAPLFMLLFVVWVAIVAVRLMAVSLWYAVLGTAAAEGSLLAVFALILLDQILTFVGIALSTTIVSIAYRDLTANARSGGPTV
jgi:hypothetical protein